MKRLNNEEIMDYLDGVLSPSRMAEIEAHLQENSEDAELVADLKMAKSVLFELEEAEPVRASEEFWPKLRDKLPQNPQRSPLRGWMAQLREMVWPSRSPMQLSLRVVAVAAILALMVIFTPKQAQQSAVATVSHKTLSPSERAFIQRNLERHSNYVSSQPLSGSAAAPLTDGVDKHGDVGSAQNGDDDNTADRMP